MRKTIYVDSLEELESYVNVARLLLAKLTIKEFFVKELVDPTDLEPNEGLYWAKIDLIFEGE